MCTDPILLGTDTERLSMLMDIRQTLSDAWNHEPFMNYFIKHKSPACFSAPSKITLKSPFFPGQLQLPTGGYALYRCAEELRGAHSVPSEWERNYQRPEQ